MEVFDEHLSLREYPEFAALTESEYLEIENNLYSRTYKKGQILFDPGDERSRIFFLTKGLIKFEKMDASGNFFYIDFAKEKTLFPYIGFFEDDSYHFSAMAMTDIELFYLPTKRFEEIIQANNQQLIFYMKQLSAQLKKYELKIQGCVTSSAFQRVKNTITILMDELGEKTYDGQVTIPYAIQMNDLSRSSGTTRETASLAIKKMVTERKIHYIHKKLTICDVSYFSKLTD